MYDRFRREGYAVVFNSCMGASARMVLEQSVSLVEGVADARPQGEDFPIVGSGVLASAA